MQLLNEDQQVQTESCSQQKEPQERLRGHRLSLTCLCINSNGEHLYTASKDGSIIKWSIESKKILAKVNSISPKEAEESTKAKNKHHVKHVNCIAISSDDRFLATGGWDKLIRIWSPDSLEWIHTFSKHRQEITCLAFRQGHPSLYSGSADRSVLLWTLEDDDNRTFVEDLYGHESPITSMDVLKRERVLTSGGRDQTIRIWKIVEQAQTVYQAKHASVDIVRYVNDKYFVSGGEDGSISVWSTGKRTPVHCEIKAHPTDLNSISNHQLNSWVTALACFPAKKQKLNDKQLPVRKRKKLNDEDALITSAHDYDNDDESNVDESDDGDADEDQTIQSTCIGLVASGSCNSEMRLWRLEKSSGQYIMKLCTSFKCPGFINDIRFTPDGTKIIVACGQEHKFGRWWKIKNSKNCMKIFEVAESLL